MYEILICVYGLRYLKLIMWNVYELVLWILCINLS
jgi:hypothetical protein